MASVGPLEKPSVVWKARTSASKALTVRASRDSSETPDAVYPAVEAPQHGPGRYQITSGVDGAQQLRTLPGRGHLTTRIPNRQPSP